MNRRCPLCGGEVDSAPTCHTWPRTLDDGTVQWMACMPCDSATWWYCAEDGDCRWSYDQGMNPANPRAAENETARPEWLGAP